MIPIGGQACTTFINIVKAHILYPPFYWGISHVWPYLSHSFSVSLYGTGLSPYKALDAALMLQPLSNIYLTKELPTLSAAWSIASYSSFLTLCHEEISSISLYGAYAVSSTSISESIMSSAALIGISRITAWFKGSHFRLLLLPLYTTDSKAPIMHQPIQVEKAPFFQDHTFQ